MYLLYSVSLCVYCIALLPLIGYRSLWQGKSIGRLPDRFGRLPAAVNPAHQRSVWVHAVSVGEVLAAKPLLSRLRSIYPNHRLLVSTTTATGQAVARQFGASVDATFYAPLDLSSFVARTLDRVKPELLVLIDTELWPNLLRACQRRGVKTALVNGRISDQSYRGYRLVRRFMRRVLDDVDRMCAQNLSWSKRLLALGASPDRVRVTGSLKFDAVSPGGADLHVGDRVLQYFEFVGERPVIVAASTMRGEEPPLLRAFGKLRRVHPDAVLIIAPRHPERFDEAREIALDHGCRVVRRTELSPEAAPSAEVVILDTIGELARLFQLATVVFVGGSLVPRGGHNLLEPAVFGKAIIFGPHMENFAEIAETFIARGGALQLGSDAELAGVFETLVADPVRRASLGAAAQALVEANRGALGRSLDALAEVLPPGSASRQTTARSIRVVSS